VTEISVCSYADQGGYVCRLRNGGCGPGWSAAVNFDAAFAVGSVFDADACGFDVADYRGVLPDLDAVLREKIAGNFSVNDDVARGDVGINVASVPDG
jgi:hypothetical protein